MYLFQVFAKSVPSLCANREKSQSLCFNIVTPPSLIEGSSLEDLLNQLCADPTKNFLQYYDFGTPWGQLYECTDIDQIQSGGWVDDPKTFGNYMCDTCALFY